jgi:3-hydroxyacyl-CoA dehydrogenase
MNYKIHQAVVIGAGTMGAALAAHLANAGVPVTLLDIVPRSLTSQEEAKGLSLADPVVRNRIVNNGLQAALKSRPASFFSSDLASLVTTGNLEDDFGVIKNADWVIEAIVENLKIKQDLMARIDEIRPEQCIVSTNTSGIPVVAIAEGRSHGFKQHFLGTHFFNPPRYLKLLEIIPTPDTLPQVVEFTSHFGEYRLGKGTVLCKDTPNFIANRLGFGGGAFALDYILAQDYTVEEVDAITGPAIGRPKTATFRLIDLVGIDVWEHVGTNLAEAIPYDEHAQRYLQSQRANHVIRTMVERGWLGNKASVGFYKMVKTDKGKEFWPLDLETLEHVKPGEKPRFDSVGVARKKETLPEKLNVFIEGDDRAADLVRALLFQGFAYASEMIPEIADTPKPLDDAMRWGFGHEAGPFEMWDSLGVAEMLPKMEAAGFPAAPWVAQMFENGIKSFYQYEGQRKAAVYNVSTGSYQPIPKNPQNIILQQEKDAGKLVAQNPGASLIDLGDGVCCVEFQTKMNSIDQDVMYMISEALDRAEAGDFDGVVIANDNQQAFSAGANLGMVLMAAKMGQWDQLEQMVKYLQDINMRIRYFPRPVVIAPAGLCLGGGAEISMHASRIVAAGELYIGQVEIGAGVIPAGGGTKELLRRVINPVMRVKDNPALPAMQVVFELIGQAKVATSAVEARAFGFLTDTDRIVMNRDHLIAEAKKEVLHMLATGWHPPAPEKIYAGGRDLLAALRAGLNMFYQGGYITEYETVIGEQAVYVLAGGELSVPAWVDEQYILDLERAAFMALCHEEKTQERMFAILDTGKPLRN